MGKKPTVEDFNELLQPTIHHDLIVVGSQESVESILNSMFKPSKQLIVDLCGTVLGKNFIMVHSVSL